MHFGKLRSLSQLEYDLSPGAIVPVRCRYPPFNPEEKSNLDWGEVKIFSGSLLGGF